MGGGEKKLPEKNKFASCNFKPRRKKIYTNYNNFCNSLNIKEFIPEEITNIKQCEKCALSVCLSFSDLKEITTSTTKTRIYGKKQKQIN